MAYLIFATAQEADQKSRDDWVSVLGRPKNPEDVTEFMWARDVGLDGRTACVIPDDNTTWGISQASVADVPLEVGTVTTLPVDNWPVSSSVIVSTGLSVG